MAEVQLVSGIITDIDSHVLLMHRRDHNQLELPGGRIEDGEMALGALVRVLHDDLGLMVTGAEALHDEPQAFTQGEVDYSCHWYRVTSFRGKPFIVQSHLYDDMSYHNLFGYNVRRRFLSPNVDNLVTAINRGIVDIRNRKSGTME